MMPPYKLADLNGDQMSAIENLENDLGLTLIAWEPVRDAVRDAAANNRSDGESDLVMDALVDTYRTYDPLI